mgnify:CR=1 FL=1
MKVKSSSHFLTSRFSPFHLKIAESFLIIPVSNAIIEFGILKVYGTIIGIFGGIGKRFESDLMGQLSDFENFEAEKSNCIIGDLNVYFSGYAYPSRYARNILNETFEKLKMENLTSEIAENVDHIIISKEFIKNKKTEIETWNLDKKLSDHIGICLTIT